MDCRGIVGAEKGKRCSGTGCSSTEKGRKEGRREEEETETAAAAEKGKGWGNVGREGRKREKGCSVADSGRGRG